MERLTFRDPIGPRPHRGRPWPAAPLLLLFSASKSRLRRHRHHPPPPMRIRDRNRRSSCRYIDGVGLRTRFARGGKNAKRGRKPRGRRRFRRGEACRALRLRGLGGRERVGVDRLLQCGPGRVSKAPSENSSMTTGWETCGGWPRTGPRAGCLAKRLTREFYECLGSWMLALLDGRVAARRGGGEPVEGLRDCSACRREDRLGQRAVRRETLCGPKAPGV